MAAPIPLEDRKQIIKDLPEGHSYGKIASKYNVSKQSVADLVNLYANTGSIVPRDGTRGPQTNKLEPYKSWIEITITDNPEWSLRQLSDALFEFHGVTVNRVSLWRFMKRQGITP